MVRHRLPSGDDLIPHLFGERNIHQMIAMDMADLAPADPVLHPAKTMRMDFNMFPG